MALLPLGSMAMPWSQPAMTWPTPSGKAMGSLPCLAEESNSLPVVITVPLYNTRTVWPFLGGRPFPRRVMT